MNDKLVKIGIIIAAHGIKGLVKIKSFAANPININKYGTVYNNDQSKKFDIKVVSQNDTVLLATVNDIKDRNTAETLIGSELYINKKNLPALDENEYYHDDLIGLEVYDQNNNIYGTITALHNFGAGDIIEIKLYNLQNKVMHSFKNAIFPKIDLGNKVITINIS
jgi:16S rRNA processing protein RimM